MTFLRERFHEAAASPSPPSRLSGDEVYVTAWRRRRVRNRLASAVVGGGAAVIVAAVAVLTTAGGPDRGAPAPAASDAASMAPSARPTAIANGRPDIGDGVVQDAVATDLDHLYAVRLRCASGDYSSCEGVLYGSDDGGRTWTERNRDNPYLLDVPAAGVIGALFPKGGNSAAWRFSIDGGRTWKDRKSSPGTISAVPADGWATCREDDEQGLSQCAVYGVDAKTGVEKKLAQQPPTITPSGINRVPSGAGLWVSGFVPQTHVVGVSVSRDDGRTWSTHVFGQGEADYPQDINNQSVGIATIDGTTAYAVVSIVTDNGQNRLLVYRTTDGGLTWQRADPGHTLPWVQHGADSFVAADGTHIVQTVVDKPAEWYAGTTGAYIKPAPVSGLEGTDDMQQPVRNDAPDTYIVFDRTAVYVSPDGLHWTQHPVKPS
ncbi:sialidase family protein [Dactylosporangium darangshiense]|uniref:sialidase family protein n=1 Tax=Dactylosporangium darangshiense TaxID=579108 RepID=UPI0031E6E87B